MFGIDTTLDILLFVICGIFVITSTITFFMFPIFLSKAIKWLNDPWITVYTVYKPFIRDGEENDD